MTAVNHPALSLTPLTYKVNSNVFTEPLLTNAGLTSTNTSFKNTNSVRVCVRDEGVNECSMAARSHRSSDPTWQLWLCTRKSQWNKERVACNRLSPPLSGPRIWQTVTGRPGLCEHWWVLHVIFNHSCYQQPECVNSSYMSSLNPFIFCVYVHISIIISIIYSMFMFIFIDLLHICHKEYKYKEQLFWNIVMKMTSITTTLTSINETTSTIISKSCFYHRCKEL